MHYESTLKEVVRGISSVLRAALQEIFDESAYARFLLRRQLQTSPEAYAEFLRENETIRQRRPRCC
jgi:hypothetical protein